MSAAAAGRVDDGEALHDAHVEARRRTRVVAAALDYQARGWAVIDLPAQTKAPTRQGWQRTRYTAADVPQVFAAAGGVGLLLGDASGGLLDVDPDTAEAAATWDYYAPPTDRRHSRPTGHPHSWYVVDAPPACTERLRDLDGSTLIELRSTGGQTVVPPSLHPTGEPLVWLAEGDPAHIDVSALQLAVRRTAVAAMLARRWPSGSRHDAALALAGLLLRGDMAVHDAERLVEVVARVAGDPEWRDRVRAVRDTAAALAAGERATGAPRLAELLQDGEAVVTRLREWLDLRTADDVDSPRMSEPLDLWADGVAGTPELPEGAAPEVIERWARDVARRIGSDPAISVMAGLAVCAAALDDAHRIQVRAHDTGWTESARLWVAAIAPSGAGKSPTSTAMVEPLRVIDLEWAREDAPRIAAWERERAAWERVARRHAEERAAGRETAELAPEPARPPRRRRIVEDITVEALSDVLRDQTTGVLAAVDELAAWVAAHDAYRAAGAGRDRALWIEAYEGRARLVERVRRGQVYVPTWSVSLVGGIQPEPLRRLVGRITDDGLIQRMLLYYAREAVAGVDAPPDYIAESAYRRLIADLVELPPPRTPYVLAADAHPVREAVEAVARAVAVLPTTPESLRGAAAKYPATYARLVLIYHVVDAVAADRVPPPVIARETCERAARLLTDYLLPHAARCHTELSGDERAGHTRWVAGYILAHRVDRVTARDVYRVRRELRGDRAEIARVMAPLELAGWLQPEGEGYGPPAKWRTNPRVHERFAARAAAERERREHQRQRIAEAVRTLGIATEEHDG